MVIEGWKHLRNGLELRDIFFHKFYSPAKWVFGKKCCGSAGCTASWIETHWSCRHAQTYADMRRHAQTCGCAKMRVPSNHPFKINHLNSILHYEPSSNLPRSWDPDFDSSSVSRPISSETCRMDVKASGLWSSKKQKRGPGALALLYIYIYNIIYTYTHTYDLWLFHTISYYYYLIILLLFNHTITISTFNIC